MVHIICKVFLIYFLLLLLMRLTGKRQIGQLQVSELISTLLISELAAISISDNAIPLAYSVIPILIIICLEVLLSFWVSRSGFAKRIFDGAPSFLIARGKIVSRELQRQRISLQELLSSLRLKDISDPATVSYAILESNGEISVITKDMKFAHALVINGKIDAFLASYLKKSETDIVRHLRKKGYALSDIMLYTVCDDGSETIYSRPS